MMFPVNRPASELTATELLNMYDHARDVSFGPNAAEDTAATVRELRAEIERRMEPCNKPHTTWNLQAQQLAGAGMGLGQGNR